MTTTLLSPTDHSLNKLAVDLSKNSIQHCSLVVPLHLVEQLTCERCAWPAFFRHSLAGRCLKAKDTVFPGGIAGNSNAALSDVGCCRPTSRHSYTSTAVGIVSRHIRNCLCRCCTMIVKRRLRSSTVSLQSSGRGTMTSVEATVPAQKLVISPIGLVASTTR